MKAELKQINGINYLSFTPEGMLYPTMLPVITKGNREQNNAWTWNGCLDKPTIKPSVKTQYINKSGDNVMIHYWLNDGICQCLNDCTDGNKGKNLALLKI